MRRSNDMMERGQKRARRARQREACYMKLSVMPADAPQRQELMQCMLKQTDEAHADDYMEGIEA